MSLSDKKILRYAKQTAGITSTPGSLTLLCTEGNANVKVDVSKIERDLRCGDMEKTARIPGPKDTGLDFSTEMPGAPTPGADSVTVVPPASIDALLRGLLGGAPQLSSGDTVSAASGVEITVDGNLQLGDMVLVEGLAGRKQVRQIEAGGGTTTPDLDRTLTDDVSAPEVAANAVVHTMATYEIDNENENRDTFYFHQEGETNAYEELGVVVTELQITIPSDGSRAMLAWTLDGNNWEKVALASPSPAIPSDGDPCIAVRSPFWIGSAMLLVRDLTLSISLNMARKPTQFGENGYNGHACTGSTIAISGGLYLGGNSLEAPGTLRAILNSKTTQDVIFQVGSEPGSVWGFRIPACDLLAQETEFEGLDGLTFEGMASRHATLSSFILGVG